MAKILKNEKTADTVSSQTFLSTLMMKRDGKQCYPNGIEVGIESVYGPTDSDFSGNKQTSMIIKCSILSDLEYGIRARKIDDDGKVIKELDEYGKNNPVIQIINDGDDGADSVTFFMKVKRGDDAKGKEEGSLLVYNKSSCFSLFNLALESNGDLENPDKQGFEVDSTELKNALLHFQFRAKAELGEFKGSSYLTLVALPSEE